MVKYIFHFTSGSTHQTQDNITRLESRDRVLQWSSERNIITASMVGLVAKFE